MELNLIKKTEINLLIDMNKSYYIGGGAYTKVKNLGWLLRHWKEIEYLGFNYNPDGIKDGQLIAKFKYKTFFSDFASVRVCWSWLNRPIFKGQKFLFQDLREGSDYNAPIEFIIGDFKWVVIQSLPYKQLIAAIVENNQ